eukprot:15481407-Alexandrium_andersonii.AAC.1
MKAAPRQEPAMATQQHRQTQQQTQRGDCTRGARLVGPHAERAPGESARKSLGSVGPLQH